MPIGGIFSAAGAAIGLGSTLASGASQSSAISDGLKQANALLQPYAATGTQASTQEANLLGLNGTTASKNALSEFTASPGYGYEVQQGLQAVDQGAASRGMLLSGNTIRAEQTLGSNLANQDFGNYYNRLSGLSQQGLNAAGDMAQTVASAAGSQAKIDGGTAGGVANSLTSGLNGLYQSMNGASAASTNGVPNALLALSSNTGTFGSAGSTASSAFSGLTTSGGF